MGLERVKSTAELSGPLRQVGARMLDAHCAKWAEVPHTEGTTVAMYFWSAGFWIGRGGLPEEAIPPSETGDGAAPVVPVFKHRGSAISHSIEDIGRDLVEPIGRLPRLLHGRAREARCTQLFG